MTIRLGLVAVIASMGATAAYAQQNLLGKYDGEYWEPSDEPGAGYPKKQEATLEITKLENGKVAGRYTLRKNYCRGTYDIQGTYQDNKLELKTGDGPKRDCAAQVINLQVQGDRLIGNTSAEIRGWPGITFSRQ